MGASLVNKASINVGIVGGTGAVGQELLKLLHERHFPMASLRLFASARSAGKTIECGGKKDTVEVA
jgi:aspartate-semialdehyde dehydrogenase